MKSSAPDGCGQGQFTPSESPSTSADSVGIFKSLIMRSPSRQCMLNVSLNLDYGCCVSKRCSGSGSAYTSKLNDRSNLYHVMIASSSESILENPRSRVSFSFLSSHRSEQFSRQVTFFSLACLMRALYVLVVDSLMNFI